MTRFVPSAPQRLCARTPRFRQPGSKVARNAAWELHHLWTWNLVSRVDPPTVTIDGLARALTLAWVYEHPTQALESQIRESPEAAMSGDVEMPPTTQDKDSEASVGGDLDPNVLAGVRSCVAAGFRSHGRTGTNSSRNRLDRHPGPNGSLPSRPCARGGLLWNCPSAGPAGSIPAPRSGQPFQSDPLSALSAAPREIAVAWIRLSGRAAGE
jgi:hypothetical protein